MNTNDSIKNDFAFFQNEVLSDIKNLETKFSDKIKQFNTLIEQLNIKTENKIKDLNSKFSLLTNQIQEKKNSENPEFLIQSIKQKSEENFSKLDIKINLIEKDLDNACYKYDKIISNNLNIPGLIGSSCPYDTLRPFLEFVNLKLAELLKSKERQTFDFKKYKEKLETIINSNKTQFETTQKTIKEFCKNGFKQCENNCIDRIGVMEKRIEALRVENGEFSFQLKQRSEELKIEWEKLDNYEKNLNIRYNEELERYNNIIDKIQKKVEKNKEEFNLIKKRFTELSEFIKDIRFRTNIHNSFLERKQYKDMSYKIDFTKKQKITNEEKQQNENKAHENDILAPFDYYAYYGLERILPEEEENNYNNMSNRNNMNINKIEDNINNKNKYNINNKYNDSNYNEIKKNNQDMNNNINNISVNNIIIQKNNNFFENKTKERTISNTKNRTQSINNINNHNNMINDNYEPEINKNNIFYIIDNLQENTNNNISQSIIKNPDQKQIINIKEKSSDKQLKIIDSNKKINIKDNNTNSKKTEKINKENNEQDKKIFLNLKESTRINDVVLGAQFDKNNTINPNNSNLNLSQAYILMKKRTEEMQKLKSIYGGNHELKYHQISTPPSLKNNIKQQSRNQKNYNLNQLNILSDKEFKKGNIEDLYYSKIKKEKFNHVSFIPKLYIRSSSLDNMNLNIFDKRILPQINYNDNQKIVYLSNNNNSNRY